MLQSDQEFTDFREDGYQVENIQKKQIVLFSCFFCVFFVCFISYINSLFWFDGPRRTII